MAEETTICITSYRIGLTEMQFLHKRELDKHNCEQYLIHCKEVKHQPDINILDYIMEHYAYKYWDGKYLIPKEQTNQS